MWELLEEFKNLLKTVDPSITHYFGRGNEAYTVWAEYEFDPLYGGNRIENPMWRVLVERFTFNENDAIVRTLMDSLNEADGVAFQYSCRRLPEKELIYHAWDCEVTNG